MLRHIEALFEVFYGILRHFKAVSTHYMFLDI